MKKSRLLYGIRDTIGESGVVVVVEGPTDVWRLGSGAVALFGKDASIEQQEKLVDSFRQRPVVILLDRDAQSHAVLLQQKLLQKRREVRDATPVIVGTLPAGRNDVGECTQAEAWASVRAVVE